MLPHFAPAAMDEATLERELCAVKGIGVWTTHMHAMFHLGARRSSPARVYVSPSCLEPPAVELGRLRAGPPPAAGSPDVLPTGDLGVRKGMMQLYGLKVGQQGAQCTVVPWLAGRPAELRPPNRLAPPPLPQDLPSPDAMHRIAEKWRPFASLGSYYMCVGPLIPGACPPATPWACCWGLGGLASSASCPLLSLLLLLLRWKVPTPKAGGSMAAGGSGKKKKKAGGG